MNQELDKLIQDSPSKKCECGCEYFDTVTIIKQISPLRSKSGKSEALLVGVLVCRKCGKRDEPSKLVT